MAIQHPHNPKNSILSLPQDVAALLNALHAAGFAAFAVGGCVRDSLLGKTPHDWDVATAATPPQLKTLFATHRLLLQGEKHGTVAVDTGARWVEVTTFRTEGAYTDARHPDTVQFVPDIQSDLLRRDFTVNALAYAPQTGLVDVCDGVADLRGGILRAVGDADARFGEDALRILRCVRFAAQLQFTVEAETEKAVHRNAPLLSQLAKERIGQEMQALLHCGTCGQVAAWYADVLAAATGGAVQPKAQPFFAAMDAVCEPPLWHLAADAAQTPWKNAAFAVRCALLCAALGLSARVCTELGFGVHMEKQVHCMLTTKLPETADLVPVRLFLHTVGIENAALCLAFHAALGEEQAHVTEKAACEIVARGDALQITDLCITGEDAAACGLQGKEIGTALTQALMAVLQNTLPNERQALLAVCRQAAQA